MDNGLRYDAGRFYRVETNNVNGHRYTSAASVPNGREMWAALDAYLGRKYERPSGYKRSVRIEREGGKQNGVHVRCYGTNVVTVYPDGTLHLRTGGWTTVTTFDVIGAFTPAGYSVHGTRHPALYTGGWTGPVYEWARPNEWNTDETLVIGPRGGIRYRDGRPLPRFTPQEWDRECKRRAYRRRRDERIRREESELNFALDRIAARRPDMTPLDERMRTDAARARIEDRQEPARIMETLAREAEAEAARARYEQQQREAAEAARRWKRTLPIASRDHGPRAVYAWKFLDRAEDGRVTSRYDGSEWTVGKWRDEPERFTRECAGLNASDTRGEAFGFVNGLVLARVQVGGRYVRGAHKITADSMRILYAWTLTEDERAACYATAGVYRDGTREIPAPDRAPDLVPAGVDVIQYR